MVQLGSKGAIFVVADGMGGHQAGEVASSEAGACVMREYYADAAHRPGESLVLAIKKANRMLHDHALSDPSKTGMGTTLVAAVILGRKVYVANVGDSRAYIIKQVNITQITEDHSWVEEQIQAGLLTRDEAERHPQRNLITRALGSKPKVEVDLFEGELHEGDVLLLCSDGLCGPVSAQQMVQAIRSTPPSQAAAQLVEQAGQQGGDDNATVLIVEAAKPSHKQGDDETKTAVSESLPPTRSLLAAIGAWLASPGMFRVGERRQRWIAGGAALLFLLCLCTAVIFLPAIGQSLLDRSIAAPHVAPIHDSQLGNISPEQLASFLGYPDPAQMEKAHGGALSLERIATTGLMPAKPGVLIVGRARDFVCGDQSCTLDVKMADETWRVVSKIDEDEGIGLRGRQVRVFGCERPNLEKVLDARFIESGSHWLAWWQRSWKTVYQTQNWDQVVWVYGVVDKSPDGLLEPGDETGLERGDQVLLWGNWQKVQDSMVFKDDRIYRREGERYMPVSSMPVPLTPVPPATATLQPTPAMAEGP
jgi:serine/threonine protein phosphatase PrpC